VDRSGSDCGGRVGQRERRPGKIKAEKVYVVQENFLQMARSWNRWPRGRHAVIRNGVEHVIDAVPEETAAAVGEVTEGKGIDVAFEAAGVGSALLQALGT
jgi:hypothetical protein